MRLAQKQANKFIIRIGIYTILCFPKKLEIKNSINGTKLRKNTQQMTIIHRKFHFRLAKSKDKLRKLMLFDFAVSELNTTVLIHILNVSI